jgi:predicted transcriptional regulator of viral defense system
MKPRDYFPSNPVFLLDDYTATLRSRSSLAVLKQHVRDGHLFRIRRGLYAVVPRGRTPRTVVIDPFVLVSKLAPDAVVAYHGALEFHGSAYSQTYRIPFITTTKTKRLVFRGIEFVPVAVPRPLRDLADLGGGIVRKRRGRTTIRVTTLERAVVDVLDAPRYGGGWDEIWRSLELVEYLDVDAVIEYALQLDSPVTGAKVGFFLEQHRERLPVEDRHLDRLRERAPRRPAYVERCKGEKCSMISRWNLIVPTHLLGRH